MARLSSLQKAERVLRFVLSLRNPKISGALVAHGFGPKDLDEVWALFRAAAPVSFAKPQPVDHQHADAERQVQEWQRRWLSVIKVSLTRHVPAAAAVWQVRQKTCRPSVPIMWGFGFITFYDSLVESRSGTGAKEARAAIKLLTSRGLTTAVVDDLRTLITRVTTPHFDKRQPRLPDTSPDIEAAIGKLWDWYLEWSQVARTQIHDGRVLRQAGFLSGDRRSKPARGGKKAAPSTS